MFSDLEKLRNDQEAIEKVKHLLHLHVHCALTIGTNS